MIDSATEGASIVYAVASSTASFASFFVVNIGPIIGFLSAFLILLILYFLLVNGARAAFRSRRR